MSEQMKEDDDAANDYWTASKSYKKSNPERASHTLYLLPPAATGTGHADVDLFITALLDNASLG